MAKRLVDADWLKEGTAFPKWREQIWMQNRLEIGQNRQEYQRIQ